jgi:hypothetical protein
MHPEEVFLFTLRRLATGFTVDNYIGRTYMYPWMLKYLEERYLNIMGHQGLPHFFNNFPRFKRAIKQIS